MNGVWAPEDARETKSRGLKGLRLEGIPWRGSYTYSYFYIFSDLFIISSFSPYSANVWVYPRPKTPLITSNYAQFNHVKKEWLIVMTNGKKNKKGQKKTLDGSAWQQRGSQLVAHSMSKRLPCSTCSFNKKTNETTQHNNYHKRSVWIGNEKQKLFVWPTCDKSVAA